MSGANMLERLCLEQGYNCGICGEAMEVSDANIDHIIPRFRKGPNAEWNYRATHKLCNSRRGHSYIVGIAEGWSCQYGRIMWRDGSSGKPLAT